MITSPMIVNCKRARLSIALSIGGDLDDDGEWELSAHLEACEGCRRHRERMQSNLPSLVVARESAEPRIHDSVWPELAERLPAKRSRRIPEFNGWWAALAVCVACAFLAAIWQNESAGKSAASQSVPVAADVNAGSRIPKSDAPETPEVTADDIYALTSTPENAAPQFPGFSVRSSRTGQRQIRLPIEFLLQ